ncbi:ABC-2 type transport system ATP-binding protein [Arenicella xantha]|uniref:ABC-2 type transport system ATP-binding protein n=1 Tax=Arenicella xantha TaxID=644221 RepID=A0A395JR34_9GAMM|nr:ABC transporter ATP-binding protein [Arenicella xantha]RBP52792.1 ABC-2 type transport system ATP-binding protein [Arenicella xantha]
MKPVVTAESVSKHYGQFAALRDLSLTIAEGQILGLIGPNGAGKTTLLRCLLGLSSFDGSLNVLGKNPKTSRTTLLQDVAYIADTAVLPSWINVAQLLEYMQGTHPKFDIAKAKSFLADTNIAANSRVKQLSKGMVTQLHLALAISIDAKLLVLDEPTLGLDILYRKRFYQQLLTDFYDAERTIIITTHQVEEIEHLLTHLIFINEGRLCLDLAMDQIASHYVEVQVPADQIEQARLLNPLHERTSLGGNIMLFENPKSDSLADYGPLRTPSIADLFVAKMS